MMNLKKGTIDSFALPPGNMGLPVIGETFDLRKDPVAFSVNRHQKYGAIFKTRVFGQPIIYVSGAEVCQFILNHEDRYFQNKMLPNIEALIGKSSVTVQVGEEHQRRKKILRKVFSPRYLNEQISLIYDITDNYLKRWIELKEFAWYLELIDYSFDIACKLFIGLDNASKTPLKNLYQTWSKGLFSFSPPLPWTNLGRALKSRKEILLYLKNVISERKKSNDLEDPKKDALSLILNTHDDDGNFMSEDEVLDQILNLLSAGHGTLASALTSFCLLLGQNPNVLEKCRQEQQSFDNLDCITLNNLERMYYLESVIKEVLRLIPPVGGGFREVIKECNFNNYRFPQGWRVIYSSLITHKDASYFASAETFNPERFYQQINTDAYFPFGGGRRRCLGENLARLELKIFGAMLVDNYDWKFPEQILEIEQIPFPHPKDNLRVDFGYLQN
jgi:cytochrome P450